MSIDEDILTNFLVEGWKYLKLKNHVVFQNKKFIIKLREK